MCEVCAHVFVEAAGGLTAGHTTSRRQCKPLSLFIHLPSWSPMAAGRWRQVQVSRQSPPQNEVIAGRGRYWTEQSLIVALIVLIAGSALRSVTRRVAD